MKEINDEFMETIKNLSYEERDLLNYEVLNRCLNAKSFEEYTIYKSLLIRGVTELIEETPLPIFMVPIYRLCLEHKAFKPISEEHKIETSDLDYIWVNLSTYVLQNNIKRINNDYIPVSAFGFTQTYNHILKKLSSRREKKRDIGSIVAFLIEYFSR